MSALTSAARAIVSKDLMPGWVPNMPPAAGATMPTTSRENAAAVYFTACVNRIFGRASRKNRGLSLQEAMVTVGARAGMPLWIPDDIAGHCCATIWHSKGYRQGNAIMANRIAKALWRWSGGGDIPIVCDANSCSLGIISEIVDYLTPENRARHAQLRIVDSIAWAHDQLLPKLVIRRKLKSAVLHPSCSANHLKLVPKMAALATAIADEVVVPAAHSCCAFAGDRGFLHPELTKSATADEAEEVRSRNFDVYLGSNRTCEIGMSLATGKDYESFIYALEELTGPVQPSAPP